MTTQGRRYVPPTPAPTMPDPMLTKAVVLLQVIAALLTILVLLFGALIVLAVQAGVGG